MHLLFQLNNDYSVTCQLPELLFILGHLWLVELEKSLIFAHSGHRAPEWDHTESNSRIFAKVKAF